MTNVKEGVAKAPKFYLAHPIKDRQDIRKWELEMEKKFGIEVLNRFFDGPELDSIKAVDSGRRGLYDPGKEASKILVDRDLEMIRSADGLVAVLTQNLTVGTHMEIFFNAYVLKKPTHIIVEHPELSAHSWLLRMSEISAGRIYKSREEFENAFLKKRAA